MLEQLKNREQWLNEELQRVKQQIEKIKIENCIKEFGVNVGSIVRDNKGKEYRVTAILPVFRKPWLECNPRNKDGEFGKALRRLFDDWELVQEQKG